MRRDFPDMPIHAMLDKKKDMDEAKSMVIKENRKVENGGYLAMRRVLKEYVKTGVKPELLQRSGQYYAQTNH